MEQKTLDNNKMGEADLIQKIIEGEIAFFEILIRRYNPVLYKIARSYGFNHQDAEDLLQETHFAAYSNLKQFAGRSSYKTWIAKIMVHKCIYKLSYGYKKNEYPDSDRIQEQTAPLFTSGQSQSTESLVLKKEMAAVLQNSLENVPDIYRSVFLLREVEGFSIAETAELLNISTVNVKVRLNRAKTLLQKHLEQYYASADIYPFHLQYCDAIVEKVFKKINDSHVNY